MGDDGHAAMGGFLAASFHALTGPDHLTCLLPFIFCKRWYEAGLYGLFWGAGHGISSSILGALAVGLKGKLLAGRIAQFMTGWTSTLIGLTLLVIGVMGLWDLHKEEQSAALISSNEVVGRDSSPSPSPSPTKSASSSSSSASEELKALAIAAESKLNHRSHLGRQQQFRFLLASLLAQFGTGFVLGLAIDAMPSVSPALWLSSTNAWLQFFSAYTFGTLFTMTCLAALVGECTSLLGNYVVLLPSRLAHFAAYGSIVTGLCWVLSTIRLRVDRELTMILLILSPFVFALTLCLVLRELKQQSDRSLADDDEDQSLPLLYVTVAKWFPTLAAAYLKPKRKLKLGDTPALKV